MWKRFILTTFLFRSTYLLPEKTKCNPFSAAKIHRIFSLHWKEECLDGAGFYKTFTSFSMQMSFQTLNWFHKFRFLFKTSSNEKSKFEQKGWNELQNKMFKVIINNIQQQIKTSLLLSNLVSIKTGIICSLSNQPLKKPFDISKNSLRNISYICSIISSEKIIAQLWRKMEGKNCLIL